MADPIDVLRLPLLTAILAGLGLAQAPQAAAMLPRAAPPLAPMLVGQGLPGPALPGQALLPIQSSPADLEAAAPRPAAEIEPFEELNQALAAARSRLQELTKTAEVAANVKELRAALEVAAAENERLHAALAEARGQQRELEQRLAGADEALADHAAAAADAAAQAETLHAAEQQVERLRADLELSEAARADLEQQLARAREEAAGELAAITASTEESARVIAGLQQDLQDSRQQAAAAELALRKTRDELTAAAERSDEAAARTAERDRQLAATREALGQQRDDLKQVVDERDALRANLETILTENANLAFQIEAGRNEIARILATHEQLAGQLDLLQTAAATAADIATQQAAATGGLDAALQQAGAEASEGAPALPEPAAGTPPPAPRRAGIAQISTEGNLVTAALARDDAARAGRIETLLVDLAAEQDARGVRLTVPGGDLFAIDSDAIGEQAQPTLARIAELLDLYREHEVLIVGHTDAIGDSGYNKDLSERRAALVKDFFAGKFDIAADRMAIAGRGEEEPIASNETLEGRRANRRVEVVILNP